MPVLRAEISFADTAVSFVHDGITMDAVFVAARFAHSSKQYVLYAAICNLSESAWDMPFHKKWSLCINSF